MSKNLLTLIMGPCAIESEHTALSTAIMLEDIERNLNKRIAPHKIEIVYKSCFHKANRTSAASFHGIGLCKGKQILDLVKKETGLRVTSDVHTPEEAQQMGDVLDIIQIPQSLSRYTSVILEAASVASRMGTMVSLKKGVFMGPTELKGAFAKLNTLLPRDKIILIERGNKFGYNDIIVDFLNIKTMNELGAISCIDASHPARSRENVIQLARAGIAMGADSVFMEVHPKPDLALCDGKTSLVLDESLEATLLTLIELKLFNNTHKETGSFLFN